MYSRMSIYLLILAIYRYFDYLFRNFHALNCDYLLESLLDYQNLNQQITLFLISQLIFCMFLLFFLDQLSVFITF